MALTQQQAWVAELNASPYRFTVGIASFIAAMCGALWVDMHIGGPKADLDGEAVALGALGVTPVGLMVVWAIIWLMERRLITGDDAQTCASYQWNEAGRAVLRSAMQRNKPLRLSAVRRASIAHFKLRRQQAKADRLASDERSLAALKARVQSWPTTDPST